MSDVMTGSFFGNTERVFIYEEGPRRRSSSCVRRWWSSTATTSGSETSPAIPIRAHNPDLFGDAPIGLAPMGGGRPEDGDARERPARDSTPYDVTVYVRAARTRGGKAGEGRIAPRRHHRPLGASLAQRGGLSEGFRRSRRPSRLARVIASSPNRFWTSSRTRSRGEGPWAPRTGRAAASPRRSGRRRSRGAAPSCRGAPRRRAPRPRGRARCRSRWLPSGCARASWCGSPRPGT